MTALMAAVALTGAQATPYEAWQKLIAPGLTYRMEVNHKAPRIVHALRFSPGAPGLKLVSALSGGTIFEDGETRGREFLSSTALTFGAIAGVNGDYFPWTGDPVGAMVIDGELVSRPYQSREAFGWGPSGSAVGPLRFAATAYWNGEEHAINGLNEECGQNMLVLNAPIAGSAVSREPALHAVLSVEGKIKPESELVATFRHFMVDETAIPIASNEMVLTATGTARTEMLKMERGEEVRLSIQCQGMDWGKIQNVVGGGPQLLRNGREVGAYAARGYNDDFAAVRHPRTAIGVTDSGDIWLVVIDGRQPGVSIGATLSETATIMRRLGCMDAVNLDGGGSTTMFLNGSLPNRPSGGAQRAICNAVLVVGARTAFNSPEYAGIEIHGRRQAVVGESIELIAVDAADRPIADSNVIWSASGAGWIDQSGRLYPVSEGECRVTAVAGGRANTITVRVSSVLNS